MRKLTRSTFSYSVESNTVCIVDKDIGMSVTNDAENVIAQLAEVLDLSRLRVIYRDTDGTWDGLVVKDRRFAGFQHLGCHDKAIAIRAIWARRMS